MSSSNLRTYPPLRPFMLVPRRMLRRRDRSDVAPMTDEEIRAAAVMRHYGRTWRWIANLLNENAPTATGSTAARSPARSRRTTGTCRAAPLRLSEGGQEPETARRMASTSAAVRASR